VNPKDGKKQMYNAGDKVMLISPDGKARKAKIESVSGPRHNPKYRIRTRRGSTYLLPGWRIESEEDYCYFTDSIDYIQSRRMRLLGISISADSGAASVFLSFDGQSYEDGIDIAPDSSLELPVDVRAIRLEAKDKSKAVKYVIKWE